MSDEWDFYFARVNDAVVFHLRGPRDPRRRAHREAAVAAVGDACDLQAPKPDGLSTNEEAPKLHEIGEALDVDDFGRPAARSSSAASPAADGASSISTPPSPASSTTRRRSAMKAFADYNYETGSTFQPEWDQYLTCCIPPIPISSACRTAGCSRRWREQGDVHEVPRKVDHWLYFADEASRARAAATRWWRSTSRSKTRACRTRTTTSCRSRWWCRASTASTRTHQRHHARARAPGRRILRRLRRLGVRSARAAQ